MMRGWTVWDPYRRLRDRTERQQTGRLLPLRDPAPLNGCRVFRRLPQEEAVAEGG